MELTHLSLFSGIGGLDLAAEWAGFRTVGQCEWADYPRAVLEKHWPGLPRWRDIRTLTKESFYEQTGLESVTVLSGGFPCQPFSTAGKRRGKEDDRYLWPEMLRVIQEIRPRWVVGENVAGIVSMALDTVLSDLESIGYTCEAVIIPACAVDAPHRRDRCAILAYTNNTQTPRQRKNGRQIHAEPETERPILCGGYVAYSESERWGEARGSIGRSPEWPAGSGSPMADTHCGAVRNDGNNGRTSDREIYKAVNTGISGGENEIAFSDCDNRGRSVWRQCELSAVEGTGSCGGNNLRRTPEHGGWEWWLAEPDVGRVAHGVPNRVDRLKCLGNAVVPQQFYPIFRGIAEVERMEGI